MRITCIRGNEIMQRTAEHYYSRQNPDDLRFTKDTINLNFPGQLEYENIYDVLNALENKKLIPRDLPSLRAVCHGGQLWTLDNKLLYIYRISPKVKRVSVVFLSGQRFLDKFFDDNSKAGIESMASAEFFPEVVNSDDLPAALLSCRAECVRLPTVAYKNPEKEKLSESRSSTPKSSSMRSAASASSSRTVASRISSEENMKIEVSSPPPRSKTFRPVRKVKASSRPTSSTNSSRVSSISEDTVETKNCYPSVNSMTGQVHSEDFRRASVRISSEENACANPFTFTFPGRPSTCRESSVASSRFSRNSFRSATRARMGKTLDALIKLETASSKTAKSHVIGAHRFPIHGQDISQEKLSQILSTKSDIGKGDPEDILEAFVLPDFCYPGPPKLSDSILKDDLVDLSSSQTANQTQISSEDGLDRSVSSCSSSTERPMLRPVQPNGGLQRFVEPSRIPLKGSVSAGRSIKCQLPTDHEFEVSKKILLKHMKKAFFSVY